MAQHSAAARAVLERVFIEIVLIRAHGNTPRRDTINSSEVDQMVSGGPMAGGRRKNGCSCGAVFTGRRLVARMNAMATASSAGLAPESNGAPCPAKAHGASIAPSVGDASVLLICPSGVSTTVCTP